MLSEYEIHQQFARVAQDVGPPAKSDDLAAWEGVLPEAHCILLATFNGFTTFHGAYRMFGLGRPTFLDLIEWNQPDTWRFAWDDRIDPFLCFGETAWGDQYAYRRRDDGTLEASVYFLEGTLLRAETLASSFEEFLQAELLRISSAPYDDLTLDAVRRFSAINPAKHWVYSPSVALGGEESISNVIEMPAVTAMIFAGDIASALRASRPGTWPSQVSPWVDQSGRNRLKVEFAT